MRVPVQLPEPECLPRGLEAVEGKTAQLNRSRAMGGSPMNKVLKPLVLLALAWMLASCATTGDRAAVTPYIDGGINFHMKGDRQLNLYQRAPHALTVCAYQLKDLNAFNQVLEEK